MNLIINQKFIPYGRQKICDDDIQAVVDVLQSDWLTTGPKVSEFEKKLAEFVGAPHAVAVSNGTAALHACMNAISIQQGDEVIVPDITFVASANCVEYMGGKTVLVDVEPETLLIDPEQIKQKITSRTKAIIAVDYAGQPCDYDTLSTIANEYNLIIVSDSCHALGASYQNRSAGTLAHLTTFSFHPVKHITTGEGGMITTNDPQLAERIRLFRNHGIATDHRQRTELGTWYYEMQELGFNYRITDIQCALGIQQLKKSHEWLNQRKQIAAQYDTAFQNLSTIQPLLKKNDRSHAYHLYVVRLHKNLSRQDVYTQLRNNGIGVNVHYIPVHQHPYYRKKYDYTDNCFPNANLAYQQILSLPIHQSMTDDDVKYIINTINQICNL